MPYSKIKEDEEKFPQEHSLSLSNLNSLSEDERFGRATINSLEDANVAWDIFLNRFNSAEVPEGVDVRFDPLQRFFAPRPVKENKTCHSDDFEDFLNGNTIVIPEHYMFNIETLHCLEEAIKIGDFTSPVLDDNTYYVFYALWLFKQNKITHQQMTTLLERAQIEGISSITKTFNLLDKKGNWTTEARELWLPIIQKDGYGGRYTSLELNRLQLLIHALPKSEQIFYLSNVTSQTNRKNKNFVDPLISELIRNQAWHQTADLKYNLHMACGVFDATLIAVRGSHGAIGGPSRIGKLSIDAIDEGTSDNYRPVGIFVPHSGVPAMVDIHGFRTIPAGATAHDSFHRIVQNALPPAFNMMLNHMRCILRAHFKQRWSSTLWELADRQIGGSLFGHRFDWDSPEEGARYFVKLLHDKAPLQAFLFRFHPKDLDSSQPYEVNDDGFAIFWHMVNHQEIWYNLYKVDINQLGHLSNTIKQIKKFRHYVRDNEHNEILALKYRLFWTATSKEELQFAYNLIDSLGDRLIHNPYQKLLFGKYHEGYYKHLSVLTFYSFGKKLKIIDMSSLHEVIENLKIMNFVQTEVNTFMGSTRNANDLEIGLDRLPTLLEQLFFLETIYKKIESEEHVPLRRDIVFFENSSAESTDNQSPSIKTLVQKSLYELIAGDIFINQQKDENLMWLLNQPFFKSIKQGYETELGVQYRV